MQKPLRSEEVDKILHAAFGLRSPNLKLNSSEPNFDVAIEGSTIRVAPVAQETALMKLRHAHLLAA